MYPLYQSRKNLDFLAIIVKSDFWIFGAKNDEMLPIFDLIIFDF